MDVIIEIISRSKRILEKYRYTSDRITIGRAYDNDLIIPDPHVSPHHAVLSEQDDGKWLVEDLNSKNGVFIGNHRLDKNDNIESGDEIQIGKSHLRIFDRKHQVADALILNPIEKVIRPLSNIWVAILLTLITLAIFAFDSYLELYQTFELKLIFSEVLTYGGIGFFWALIWSFIGRVIKHDPRFAAQLGIVMIYLTCGLLLDNIIDLLVFNTGSTHLITAINSISHFIFIACLLWLNLYLATNQPAGKRISISSGIAATVIGLGLLTEFIYEPDFKYQPEYDYTLNPPAFYWGTPTSVEEFIDSAEEVFMVVDDEREAD